MIDNCLTKHFFMRTLDKYSRGEIIKEMNLAFVEKDSIIFSQGSIGSYFYIIRDGEVELYINNNLVKTLSKGESFGELALLHGATRSGTCKASKGTYFWVLERRIFRKIIDHINNLNFEENKKFLQSIPILNNIENDQKSILCSNLNKEYYDIGSYVVKSNMFSYI